MLRLSFTIAGNRLLTNLINVVSSCYSYVNGVCLWCVQQVSTQIDINMSSV